MNAAIRRSRTRKYYMSIFVETEVPELPKTNSSVGIDVGLKDFATLSTGKGYANPKWFRSTEKKLAQAQRILSRRKERAIQHGIKVSEAKNYQKQRMKVARLHERMANMRADDLHKISTPIVKSHDIIGIEDLQVSTMVKNKTLSKAISEVSPVPVSHHAGIQSEVYGKQVVRVAKNYPSSQLCSTCGTQHQDVKNLALRAWTCPTCDTLHDRDLNASINIRNEALRLTVGTTGIA